MMSPADLKERLLTQGCYSPDENLRIYNKWFASGPRHIFRAVNKKYSLTGKVICDLGCLYGTNLAQCQPGSYGIEVDEYAIAFARSIGLTVYDLDMMVADISHLPKVDAVWCSAVLEHVEGPHIFLRRIYSLLQPGGLLVIFVPTIPLIPALRQMPLFRRFLTGYLQGDHINAFVPSTLRFFCERSGFETLELSPFYPAPLSVLNRIPYANRLMSGCVYVGRKIEDWNYPESATRRAADSTKGFVYIQGNFSK